MKKMIRSVSLAMTVVLSGCAVQPVQPVPTRTLDVEITTKSTGLVAYIYPGNNVSARRELGTLPLKATVPIGNGSHTIFFRGFSGVDSYLTPKNIIEVSPDQNSVKENVEVVSFSSVLSKEFKSFSKPTKLQIVKIISSLEVTSKTIKRDFNAKLADTKGELSVLKIDDEKFKDSAFSKKIEQMVSSLNAAAYLDSISSDFYENMKILKQVTGV